MTGRRVPPSAKTFDRVTTTGLALPGVESATRYDGSPLLKLGGCFLAGLASHRSAEHATLVVRCRIEDRRFLIEDAPDIYYVTDYYQRHPVVLARLSRLDGSALRDLLSMSYRLTKEKTRQRRQVEGHNRTADCRPRTAD